MDTSKMPFLQACKGEKPDHTPIWIMRQAGRYLPQYQALRSKHSFLEMCHTPELAAEVTLQPMREFGFDASIIFSDILIPFEPMGIKVEFVEGRGPQLSPQLRSRSGIEALKKPEFPGSTGFLAEALRLVRSELEDTQALIGFAGAPWTMACYAVEGMGSRNYAEIKKMLNSEPETLELLLNKITDTLIEYLAMQLEAGANAIQIFDSWADALSPEDYARFSLPYIERLLEGLSKYRQPKILFSKDAAVNAEINCTLPIDVLGIDWRANIASVRRRLGDSRPKAFQGNLDPIALLGTKEIMLEKARTILDENANHPGYIFNLGHGITPPTPVENVRELVNFVQSYKA